MTIGTIDGLTADELELIDAIDWHQYEGAVRYWADRADARSTYLNNRPLVPELLKLLSDRKAIPDIRWRYFADPKLGIGLHGKSHKDIFEGNGSSGLDMITHPHFLPYLWYFIHGSRLPLHIKNQVATACGDSLNRISDVARISRSLLRQAARNGQITHYDAGSVADEFYKLILDCGQITYADIVRASIVRVARETLRR